MRASDYYAPTLRKAPGDAELASHKLLVRAGFIRPLSAGLFTWLPMGLRVLRNIEGIVREEMNRSGAIEVHMPVLSPRELWERTGRWGTFQPPLFHTTDRGEHDFVLGPTHEEVFTDIVARDLRSYRDLPFTLYQIQVKFRDELRPRGGLLRVKEFLMKDAYSFDVDDAGLQTSFDAQYDAYERIFERLSLPTLVVQAHAGSMGGTDTREFMVLTEAGEDVVFMCKECGYAANAECAEVPPVEGPEERESDGEPELAETPGMSTIEQVSEFLDEPPEKLAKTLLYKADGEFIAAMVRGDRDLNEFKLSGLLGADLLEMAGEEEILQITGAGVGYTGPVGLPANVRIIADHEIEALVDFVVGANETDAHLVGVEVGRDFEVDQYADIRQAVEGDTCPGCGGTLTTENAIEMAHIFKLGRKYAEDLDASFQDKDGEDKVPIMGCYGFGVSRAVAAVVEMHHDDNGIIWPMSIAPFHVCILLLDPDVEELNEAADELEGTLTDGGYEVMVDDRDDRAGVKFNDADLIGYPIQIVLGRRTINEGLVEVRRRKDQAEKAVPVSEVAEAVEELAEEA